MLVAHSCSAVCYPTDCSPPDSPVHGVPQGWVLDWVVIPFSGGSFQPRDQTRTPALQADSLPSEPPGKPGLNICIPPNSYVEILTLHVMVFGDGAFGVIRPRGQNWPQASFCHVGRQQEVSSMKPGQQPAPEADRADNQITDFPRSELCEGNSIFVSYRSLCYFLIAVWSDYDNYLSLAKLIFTEWTNDLKEFWQRTWTEDDADSGRTSDQ